MAIAGALRRIFQPFRNLFGWPRLRGSVETTQTRYDVVSEATGTAGRLRCGGVGPYHPYLQRRESRTRDVWNGIAFRLRLYASGPLGLAPSALSIGI